VLPIWRSGTYTFNTYEDASENVKVLKRVLVQACYRQQPLRPAWSDTATSASARLSEGEVLENEPRTYLPIPYLINDWHSIGAALRHNFRFARHPGCNPEAPLTGSGGMQFYVWWLCGEVFWDRGDTPAFSERAFIGAQFW